MSIITHHASFSNFFSFEIEINKSIQMCVSQILLCAVRQIAISNQIGPKNVYSRIQSTPIITCCFLFQNLWYDTINTVRIVKCEPISNFKKRKRKKETGERRRGREWKKEGNKKRPTTQTEQHRIDDARTKNSISQPLSYKWAKGSIPFISTIKIILGKVHNHTIFIIIYCQRHIVYALVRIETSIALLCVCGCECVCVRPVQCSNLSLAWRVKQIASQRVRRNKIHPTQRESAVLVFFSVLSHIGMVCCSLPAAIGWLAGWTSKTM